MKNLLLLSFLFFMGCQAPKLITYDFPKPVDTADHPIQMQEKKTYHIGEITLDNEFDGARVNNFYQDDSNNYQLVIEPENYPINPSPWYAFRIASSTLDTADITIHYHHAKHRYAPKWSTDGLKWQLLDSNLVAMVNDSTVTLHLPLSKTPLWISAQELHNSAIVKSWCETTANDINTTFITYGKSKLGRALFGLDIHQGETKDKPIIVIMSRQHPPEVTGYLAMQKFVETILADTPLSNDFRKKYHILVFPLMNPDGVDLGHWRHNAGGIDLNRDWAYYRQPETRQMAQYVLNSAHENKTKVYLGLDFHSTYDDRYYTFDKSIKSDLYHFKDYWIDGIKNQIEGYEPKDLPGGLIQPISKNWFYLQFKAEAVTYEIGDTTPRSFIKEKAKISANEMMKLLIFR